MGYQIIKIFPAKKLGLNFLNKLKNIKENDIFFIGAGGINTKNLKILLTNEYNALAIGKELKNQIPDKDLLNWLKDY